MRTAAVICEYNPFHRGHAYQLAAAREHCRADVLVCVMSELVTQRGELAVCDGYARAETAVRCGADVVVTLPFPWSAAAAEHFADAGVYIATALGATHLHFGSECGDISRLEQTARLLASEEYTRRLRDLQHTAPELGVMAAKDAVLAEMTGSTAHPDGSNDILALAYLAAITRQSSPLIPVTVRRHGQDFRDTSPAPVGQFASASALRRAWAEDGDLCALREQLPDASFDALQRAARDGLAPTDAKRLLPAVVAFLRLADPDTLAGYAELGGGVAQRLIAAAKGNAPDSIDGLIAAAATKRYTNARLSRAVWYGMCGVRPDHLRTPPAYTRLLGVSERGRSYLSIIRKSCPLPIVTKPADLPQTDAALAQSALEGAVAALYSLALPIKREAAYLMRRSPFIEKNG